MTLRTSQTRTLSELGSCFSLQRSKQSSSYHCYSQAREETKPSFDPQFLQNRASAGLAVLQFSQIFDTCVVPVRGVTSGHGRTGFSSELRSRVRWASTEPYPPRNPH